MSRLTPEQCQEVIEFGLAVHTELWNFHGGDEVSMTMADDSGLSYLHASQHDLAVSVGNYLMGGAK